MWKFAGWCCCALFIGCGTKTPDFTQWQTYTPPNGAFVVKLPVTPRHQTETQDDETQHQYICEVKRDLAILVSELDSGPDLQLNDDAEREEFLDVVEKMVLANSGNGRLLTKTSLKHEGKYAARDIVAEFTKPGIGKGEIHLRILMKGNKCFQLLTLGDKASLTGFPHELFLDSFVLK